MATTIDVTAQYSGKELIPLLIPMYDSMREVKNGDVTLHNDVNYKKALRKVELSGALIGDETAAFTPSGDTTVKAEILYPTIREVNLQVEKDEFRSEWSGARMGSGQLNKKMTQDIIDGVTKNILGKVGMALRSQMWNAAVGSASNQLPSGGFMTAAKAAGDTKVVDSESVAISADNVLDELSKLVQTSKQEVLDFEKTRIFIASDVWGHYCTAVGNQSVRDATSATPMMFAGYKLVLVPEFAAGEMMLANKDNLHYGTDVFSDNEYVELIDLSHTTGDRFIRFIQKVSIDAKIGYTDEVTIRYDVTPV